MKSMLGLGIHQLFLEWPDLGFSRAFEGLCRLAIDIVQVSCPSLNTNKLRVWGVEASVASLSCVYTYIICNVDSCVHKDTCIDVDR